MKSSGELERERRIGVVIYKLIESGPRWMKGKRWKIVWKSLISSHYPLCCCFVSDNVDEDESDGGKV